MTRYQEGVVYHKYNLLGQTDEKDDYLVVLRRLLMIVSFILNVHCILPIHLGLLAEIAISQPYLSAER